MQHLCVWVLQNYETTPTKCHVDMVEISWEFPMECFGPLMLNVCDMQEWSEGAFPTEERWHSNFQIAAFRWQCCCQGLLRLENCVSGPPPTIWTNHFHRTKVYGIQHLYGGFLQWWYPQIINFNRVFRFSIINHPFWGTPIFENTYIV